MLVLVACFLLFFWFCFVLFGFVLFCLEAHSSASTYCGKYFFSLSLLKQLNTAVAHDLQYWEQVNILNWAVTWIIFQ